MDAYLTGLEQATSNGHDISEIHSVASFFVSRVDTEIDRRLQGHRHSPKPQALLGEAAIANARLRLPGLRTDLHRRPLGRPRRRGREQTAPAVGLHRRQGPQLRRHPLRRRTRRARHRQHRAREDHRRRPRSRRHPRQHHRGHATHRHPRSSPHSKRSASISPTCSTSWKPKACRSSNNPGPNSSNPSARNWIGTRPPSPTSPPEHGLYKGETNVRQRIRPRPARANTASPVGSVGVVGLGVMGHAIATRLHQQLGALAVSDLRRDAANDLVEAGASSTRPPPKPPRTATSWCCP